jgi:hypothetical protein
VLVPLALFFAYFSPALSFAVISFFFCFRCHRHKKRRDGIKYIQSRGVHSLPYFSSLLAKVEQSIALRPTPCKTAQKRAYLWCLFFGANFSARKIKVAKSLVV